MNCKNKNRKFAVTDNHCDSNYDAVKPKKSKETARRKERRSVDRAINRYVNGYYEEDETVLEQL